MGKIYFYNANKWQGYHSLHANPVLYNKFPFGSDKQQYSIRFE